MPNDQHTAIENQAFVVFVLHDLCDCEEFSIGILFLEFAWRAVSCCDCCDRGCWRTKV